MNISTILKSLDISKMSAITTLIFGGWADLAVLVCKAFTNLLRKADPTKLKLYAEFSAKVAKAIRFIVDLFISGENVKAAAISTCVALETFSNHVADGDYTPEELDEDIDNIENCVADWKKVAEKK